MQMDSEAENTKAFLIVNEIILTLKDVSTTSRLFTVLPFFFTSIAKLILNNSHACIIDILLQFSLYKVQEWIFNKCFVLYVG